MRKLKLIVTQFIVAKLQISLGMLVSDVQTVNVLLNMTVASFKYVRTSPVTSSILTVPRGAMCPANEDYIVTGRGEGR